MSKERSNRTGTESLPSDGSVTLLLPPPLQQQHFVLQAMGGRWNPIEFGFQFLYLLILIFTLQLQGSFSLNYEGLALLEFRARVVSDPQGAFTNWNKNDTSPCSWSGVHCHDGKVHMLDMKELCLEGTLSPELGKLTELIFLILPRNRFSGAIPKEFGELTKLKVLDLRNNELSGTIPVEIGGMLSLRRLLLCDNKFEGGIPIELKKLDLLYELQFDENLTSAVATEIKCVNRKFGHCIWHGSLMQLNKQEESFIVAIKEVFTRVSVARRRLLEQSSNLLAPPATVGSPSDQIIALPTARSSGAFPAVPNAKKRQYPSPAPQPSSADTPVPATQGGNSSQNPTAGGANTTSNSSNIWKYIFIIPAVVAVLIIAAATYIMCRSRTVRTIGPWKTGLSGQLQKAFVTGVPKLNRSELETACEDFSNIIDTVSGCTIYKGTLSSGVEIAVASTTIKSSKYWSKSSEMAYRKKIDTLSRVNHKNFVNLIGFCEEDSPFNRMMVFEYAPNGTLFEHLHDDYAAKVAEISFATQPKSKVSGDNEDNCELPPLADPDTNVHSFGILMLEIISGKLPYSEEHGPLEKWAAEYLNDKRTISYMIDRSLKSFKNHELDIVCEVIQECIQPDSRQRPTMKDIVAKLRQVINISPDQATPKLSPLWWAELEILSAEAT
ncbi:hypothetical protein EZV62_026886 [Acer yangbiense]|uniref:Protein kinase domain-containing protein n=1 Tax=Acer yangbiense TaxID=1000413 RepID=A0A5C7GTE8_9ROSI|nr:hypothetical protein EZV62_026886 [Acer yangbiense]